MSNQQSNPDRVTTYPADGHDLETYARAAETLSTFLAPRLVRNANPHERLLIAAFDGTGNSLDDPAHFTNVGLVHDQVRALQRSGERRVHVEYAKGPGTQANPLARVLDMATGFTYQSRIEDMYERLCRQAQRWLKEDPQAQIRVANLGFSRGAEEAAGFARLLHERGIVDPDSRRAWRDDHGRLHVEYARTLVPPGETAQVLALLDPVGTGEPRQHDRRPPPSVLSGFQITAEDERRNLFQSTRILDPGLTADGRFLNVTVGGSHSDIGGSYLLNGLAVRNFNLVADYLNALGDRPFLRKLALPEQALDVVHRSEQHQPFYRTSVYDRQGERGAVERLAPPLQCRVLSDCSNAEAIDAGLSARFDRAPVAIGPVPVAKEPVTAPLASHPQYDAWQRLLAKVRAADLRDGAGLDPAALERISAQLLATTIANPAMRQVDEVLITRPAPGGEPRVFAIYRPHGAQPPQFTAAVDATEAVAVQVERSLDLAQANAMLATRDRPRAAATPAR